jgi:hypothetical protein
LSSTIGDAAAGHARGEHEGGDRLPAHPTAGVGDRRRGQLATSRAVSTIRTSGSAALGLALPRRMTGFVTAPRGQHRAVGGGIYVGERQRGVARCPGAVATGLNRL